MPDVRGNSWLHVVSHVQGPPSFLLAKKPVPLFGLCSGALYKQHSNKLRLGPVTPSNVFYAYLDQIGRAHV